MKSFRQLFAAFVLTLAICVPAFAGDMNSPPRANEGPQESPGIAGEINSPPRTAEGTQEALEITLLLFAIDLLV
jgi:hypothetical protein